jgi:hypothetical protein
VLKNFYAPHPRARPTLKFKVTYYEFLQEERWLQTSRDANNFSWAFASTPSRQGSQCSKSNKLESTGLTKTKCSKWWNGSSLARISSLATLSLESLKKISQEMKKGSESFWKACEAIQLENIGKIVLDGGGRIRGYLYPYSQKLAIGESVHSRTFRIETRRLPVGERIPGYSGYMSGYYGHCSRTFRTEVRRLWFWQRRSRNIILKWFYGSHEFVWVLLSTSSKLKPADQSPYGVPILKTK